MTSLADFIRFLAIALLTLGCAMVLVGRAKAEWWESSKEFKEWELVDHLRDPDAMGRAHAAAMLADRWSGPDYVKLLKEDWQAGMEALAGGWPAKNDAPLATYLLTVERKAEMEREDAAYALSANLSGDRIALYSGPIRDIALRQWCGAWCLRIPRCVALPGPLWYAANAKRRWLRDYFYANGEWTKAWGWSEYSGYTWRVDEYRQCLALFAGDQDHVDQKFIDKNDFLLAVQSACKDGKNPCDVDMSTRPDLSFQLPSRAFYDDFGGLTRAELVCVVMDRPEWLPAVWKRLEKVTTVYRRLVFDPALKVPVVKETVETMDLRTPFLMMLHDMQMGKPADAMARWAEYKRDKWDFDSLNKDALLHHPWAKKCVTDKAWPALWEKEDLPMDWSKFDDTFEGAKR